ncbi:MAG TPA: hypothetical protein VFS21_21420 [Roseiflexaceae bacterium]|nr:hypothetical protein [Roseiflexaceae bacterium]
MAALWVRNPCPCGDGEIQALARAIQQVYAVEVVSNRLDWRGSEVGSVHIVELPPRLPAAQQRAIMAAVQLWHQAILNGDVRVQRDHPPERRSCAVELVQGTTVPSWAE